MDRDAPARAGRLRPGQLARLLDVGRSLVAELDLETVLRHVLDAARDLTTAQYAALESWTGTSVSSNDLSSWASTRKRESESDHFLGVTASSAS